LQLSFAMAAMGAVLALATGWLAAPLGKLLGLLDWPDTDGGRKRHGKVTPLVGGLALTVAALLPAVLGWLTGPAVLAHDLGWLAFCVGAMFLIGVSDDKFQLSPVVRLMGALVVLVLVISRVPDFALAFLYFGGGERLWLLSVGGAGFTLICLLGLLNAVNMADGKNGVVIGQGLIWSGVLAVHLPEPFWPVLAAAAGALAGLMWANMHGRLFLGDGGSYAVSSLFGLLAVLTYNQSFEVWHADDVALLFALPVLDTIRLVAVRLARRRSPFEGDRDHLHHHLYAQLGWPMGLWVYLALVALPNAAALLMPGTGWLWLALTTIIFAAIIRLMVVGPEELPDPAE
jgi:UDP-GlcNAc:undecaprenyl-phosphate GlcNAc-1-phosphate transferase